MSLVVLALIFVSVTLSSLAQLALKYGMSSESIQSALHADRLTVVLALGSNVAVLSGLALYALGAAVWLLVLAKVDLSIAYPFVGFGFILTTALSSLILGEPIGITRLVGTAMIAAGAGLVARS